MFKLNSPFPKKMGEFKQDLNTPVKNYIKYQSDAFEMMLKAGWK